MGTKLESVKVGGVVYSVTQEPVVIDSDGDKVQELWGQILYGEAQIKLSEKGDDQNRRATVLHEILHAILHQAGYSDHSEGLLDALSYGVAQVIRENPALIDYLRGEGDDATSGT